MARVVPYCRSDVEVMVHGFPLLEQWRDLEPDVVRTARAINERGIGFDVQLAQRLLEEDARNSEQTLDRIARELGEEWTASKVRDVANSPAQFAEWTGAENARAETIESIIANPEAWSEGAVLLAHARQSLASIARGKLEAGLAHVSPDSRLRDAHKYYGAHTGRCSGRGMQLHNMPRPAKRFEKWGDADICKLADAVLAGAHVDADEIDLLVRACLVARPGHTFAVCDFSGIEGRATAWHSGDVNALDVIASGKDAYIINAAQIFGVRYEDIAKSDVRRQAGKVAELACGYQGGWRALEKMAKQQRVNLTASGADSKKVVAAWRALHPQIVQAWADCEAAFLKAARGEQAQWSHFSFVPSSDGEDVAIFMPCGRPIVYPKVEIGNGKYGKPSLTYEGHHDARPKDENGERYGVPAPIREHVYGGLVLENIIQSWSRDVMTAAMVRVEDDGLCPELEVYDELVCEVPANAAQEGYEYLHAIMIDVPEWAQGFPVAAAGHTGKRYRK
jgi:DNA polymerase